MSKSDKLKRPNSEADGEPDDEAGQTSPFEERMAECRRVQESLGRLEDLNTSFILDLMREQESPFRRAQRPAAPANSDPSPEKPGKEAVREAGDGGKASAEGVENHRDPPRVAKGERRPQPSDKELPFRTLGDYRIIRELGRGGMGIVYEAHQISMDRRVALKVLPRRLLANRKAVARFKREARAASRIDHPAICTVYDSGVARGVPYIAMRYVEGETLAKTVYAARGETSKCISLSTAEIFAVLADTSQDKEEEEELDGELDAPPSSSAPSTQEQILSILQFFDQAARAIHAAHEAGLVHRDIKPGNLIVTKEGDPVILDFGLARSEDDLRQPPNHSGAVTQEGDLVGTPAYMSPEQIVAAGILEKPPPYVGRHGKAEVDRRTDVFSFGVTLYECLTLRHPFPAKSRDGIYRKILFSDPQNPQRLNPRISDDLRAVLERALEKDPKRRYQTALELAEDLRRIRNFEPVRARPAGPVIRMRRWSQRNRFGAALIVTLLTGLLGLGALSWFAFHARDDAVEAQLSLDVSRRYYATLVEITTRERPGRFTAELRDRYAKRRAVVPDYKAGVLTYGLYTSDNPETMYQKFDPILYYLQDGLGRPIDMIIYPTYEEAIDAMIAGKVDFVRFGAASYVEARSRNRGIRVLAVEEKNGATTFRGFVIVRKNSKVGQGEIWKLKGKRLAFGDPHSTISTYLFQGLLVKAGIHSTDLMFDKFDSHEDVADQVLGGKYFAGAVKEDTFDAYKDRGVGLKAIATICDVPAKVWTASSKLDGETVQALSRTLKTAPAAQRRLISKSLTGFVTGDDGPYENVEQSIKASKEFWK